MMSESKLTIYNSANEKVAYSKFGVMWRMNPSERLGEFFNNQIFDNSQKQLGYLKNGTVYTMDDSELGVIQDSIIKAESGAELKAKALFKNGVEIGKCFPEDFEAASAGLIFLGNELD